MSSAADIQPLYELRTKNNEEWYPTDFDGTVVTGVVRALGGDIGVDWVFDANSDLFCRGGRAHDVRRRGVPITGISYPVRLLDTDFVISTLQAAMVFYSVQLTTSLTLSGTDTANADLLLDGAHIFSSLKNSTSMTLGLGVTQTVVFTGVLSGIVPIGRTVRIASSGTGLIQLLASTEVLL